MPSRRIIPRWLCLCSVTVFALTLQIFLFQIYKAKLIFDLTDIRQRENQMNRKKIVNDSTIVESNWQNRVKSNHGRKSILKVNTQSTDNVIDRVVILFWSSVYSQKIKESGYHRFRNCEYRNCYLTSNRSLLAESNAVVFHMWNLARDRVKDLPTQRWPHQRWVLYGHESARNANFSLYYDEEFNMTVTYKDDADVFFGYGCFSKIPQEERTGVNVTESTINYAKGKSRLVAWVISHCNAGSRRDDYIRELSKHIRVDGYGRCAKRPCTDAEKGRKDLQNRVYCNIKLKRKYKFFLSFENSLCGGYVTEKAWNKLANGIVPIVLGSSNYYKILPPNSFIDVRNFSSPKSLANYLLKVDVNDEIYNSYFNWKKKYQLSCASTYCDLCKYLNTYKRKKVYRNIGKWWNNCQNVNDFYKGVADMII